MWVEKVVSKRIRLGSGSVVNCCQKSKNSNLWGYAEKGGSKIARTLKKCKKG